MGETAASPGLRPLKPNVFWFWITVIVAWRSRSAPGTSVAPHAHPVKGWPLESYAVARVLRSQPATFRSVGSPVSHIRMDSQYEHVAFGAATPSQIVT